MESISKMLRIRNSEAIEKLLALLVSIAIIVAFFVWQIPIAIREGEERKAKRNATCVEQYGEGSYYKAIKYGRRASTVEYCVTKDGNLKIFKEK